MNARIGLLSLVLLMIPLLAAGQEEPLALLMAQQGEVTVVRGADALTGEFGMYLDLGDEIRTGLDSSADILFATGQALKLGPNGSLVVQTAPGGTGGACVESWRGAEYELSACGGVN